jgi:hypothetical protein
MIWWLLLTAFLWFNFGLVMGMMVARMVIVSQGQQ